MYRLIALDVDGTLLNDQHRLPPATRAAILQAQARGARFCLATGKLLASVRPLVETLHLTGPQITCNGAALMDGESGAALATWPLEVETRKAALDLMRAPAWRRAVAWYTADAIYTDAPMGELDDILAAYHEPPLRRVARLDANLPPALKLLMSGAPERIYPLLEYLTGALGARASVMRTTADFVEIVSPAVSKGRALAELAGRLGVARDEIIAFGDGENDIALFEASGLGIAMSNAMPALTRYAGAITASANESGVAHALTALGFANNGDASRVRWK